MKNIIILAAIIVLCQCKKNPEAPYSNENIVMDNAQAALYFHTIFREVENAWAFIYSMEYKKGKYPIKSNKSSSGKELTYDEKNVTIEYNNWETGHLYLSGTITVSFGIGSYRKEGSIANVYLTDFSINQQYVVGGSSIKFIKKVAGKEKEGENGEKEVEYNDTYTFTLLEGAAIHEIGFSMPVLITCTIANGGQYERIDGNNTLEQDDDVWVFSGVMTGMLHDDPNLKYTNTVNPTSQYEVTVNGKTIKINGKVQYSTKCRFAEQGLAQIKIAKRPDIDFIFNCSGYHFFSVTHVE